jgi:uncharacterized protein (TIGR03083 family)
MNPTAHLAVIDERSATLLDVARTAVASPVPGCPDWTVGDVVRHVGRVWGWAATAVETGEHPEFLDLPDGWDAFDWATAQRASLITRLSEADPDSSCWTFGDPPTRAFWFRRQALETAVHACDVERAAGRPTSFDRALALEGIEEFLRTFLPRLAARNGNVWHGESLHLHATDGEGEGEWTIVFNDDGTVRADASHQKADVAVRGPAELLYLWCLNRVSSAELECFGDEALAHRWSSAITF